MAQIVVRHRGTVQLQVPAPESSPLAQAAVQGAVQLVEARWRHKDKLNCHSPSSLAAPEVREQLAQLVAS